MTIRVGRNRSDKIAQLGDTGLISNLDKSNDNTLTL